MVNPRTTWPGDAFPLGASWDGRGTNFSVFSEVAERVELCLLGEAGDGDLGADTEERIELVEVDGHCWHAYLPGVEPGARYGFRVHGPWVPEQGLWCNPAQLLLDPYAKVIDGSFDAAPGAFAHDLDDPERRSDIDSRPHVPTAVVHSPYFEWGGDRPPRVPMHETVIYEAHVRGLTIEHPEIDPGDRGTYRALAHPAVVDHLIGLGVTTLELMPVHQFVHDGHLRQRGLSNYWGYNSIGFFAPHSEYAATRAQLGQVQEFKDMVRTLHEAGIEVVLDVVYNHTAEGNERGPTLSFRGLDNPAYYRLVDDDRRYYFDVTGTGNTLNMRHPHVLQLVMDSLRYWVTEMHVDGFRFDLASALARGLHQVDRLSAFFDLVHQDPVISQVKLIAEPWDVGEGGYQVGNFPALWSEWNGRYRDTIRDYWRGADATIGEFASRITGSSDLYENDRRHPVASVNFVTAHDGFTLADLVAYDERHNEANGEENRDGESHNRSWNCGVEGPTGDPAVLDLRRRQRRNLYATLLLSQGIPMIRSGDELVKSQDGNNNAYCQDNQLSWLSWAPDDEAADMLGFAREVGRLRREHPVFRRRRWFGGTSLRDRPRQEIAWYRPDGIEMDDHDWDTGFARALGLFLGGDLRWPDDRGQRVQDDSFLLLVNAHHEPVDWVMPPELAHLEAEPVERPDVVVAADADTVDRGGDGAGSWCTELDTAAWPARPECFDEDGKGQVAARSLVLLRAPRPPAAP